MCVNLKFTILISAIFVIGIFSINFSFADDELPIISIELEDGNIIDLDDGAQFVRATIDIVNYSPSDGYYYMKVTRLFDGEIIKESEILPTKTYNDLWSVKIQHYIDTTLPDEELLGDYELEIYSEFGTASAGTQISIIKSSLPQISTNSTSEILEIETEPSEETEDANEPTNETNELIEEEPQIPDWVRNIFVWYGEGTITEADLLFALEYLINQGIINVEI